ncbi:hypothetical protein CTI14_48980, partial [Methylobacterium radiotolerans]
MRSIAHDRTPAACCHRGSTPPGASRTSRRAVAARTTLAADVPAAALLDRRSAIFTGPVPLHPG